MRDEGNGWHRHLIRGAEGLRALENGKQRVGRTLSVYIVVVLPIEVWPSGWQQPGRNLSRYDDETSFTVFARPISHYEEGTMKTRKLKKPIRSKQIHMSLLSSSTSLIFGTTLALHGRAEENHQREGFDDETTRWPSQGQVFRSSITVLFFSPSRQCVDTSTNLCP